MPEKPNPYLESLKANKTRIEEALKNPKLSPEAQATKRFHLAELETEIKKLEGAK